MTNPSDYGTKELSNRHDLKVEETMKAGVFRAVNKDASVLDRYHNRHRLSGDHREATAMYDAGSRLAGDWAIIGGYPSIIADYTARIPGGGISFAEAREIARTNYDEAISKIGIGKSQVIQVCCHDEAVGQRGLAKLRLGLKQLSAHYYD